ncbi:uncharacterized protein LOC136749721 isoform X2 [Amia ocellicauda]|uniref:uncharacterized protein LOC136749721 isoform X2 n=1 Tax=Amia ocellicauda TaxID=2972642 RepID=UPI003463A95F
MATQEHELVFESFLKKRKDKLRLKWATYWFRLQNSTLFFYTKKHGSASHLRGQYYIYTVQSVREVKTDDSKQFMFEITMKNGKKKLLAAATEELRSVWVSLLWKAMQLPGPGRTDSACIWHDVADLTVRGRLSTHSSDSDSTLDSDPRNSALLDPFAPPLPTTPPPHSAGNTSCSQRTSTEEEEQHTEGAYDMLPPTRALEQPIPPGQEEEEEEKEVEGGQELYDVPASCREASGGAAQRNRVLTESIYDVPRSVLRRSSEDSKGLGAPSGGSTLLDDIKRSLGSDHVSWINDPGEM